MFSPRALGSLGTDSGGGGGSGQLFEEEGGISQTS